MSQKIYIFPYYYNNGFLFCKQYIAMGKYKKIRSIITTGILFSGLFLFSCGPEMSKIKLSYNNIHFEPETYVCYHVNNPIIVDGIIDSSEWGSTPWTNYFVDIEGDKKPLPLQNTRVKMLWDDEYFYIAAELEENHIWGKLTERESVIFYDNDFEVFIDPTGDTHQYYELEINALETIWDLMLIKPYRDGGPAIDSWDIQGLKSGLSFDGTLNDPSDVDKKWTIELAFPFKVLEECAPNEEPPKPGDQWRINFSRVQWITDIVDGKYVKKTDPATGENFPEFNWVWSPQGLINLHFPEMWAYVQFSNLKTGLGIDDFIVNPDEQIKWALRQVYYQENRYMEETGAYTDDLNALGLDNLQLEGINYKPKITLTPGYYIASLNGSSGDVKWYIRPDGLVWKR